MEQAVIHDYLQGNMVYPISRYELCPFLLGDFLFHEFLF